MGKRRVKVYTGFWWGNLRQRDHLEDQGVDGRIILRWMFRKWEVGVWTEWSWLGIGTGDGPCECDNELSGSTKCGEFFDLLRTSWLFKHK
jgi:hypothetical protein